MLAKLKRTYETKVPCLSKYLEKVKDFLENFDHFKLKRILQSENDHANAIAKLASMKMSNTNWSIIQSIMLEPSIERNKSMCVNEKENWMDLIKAYLKNQTFPKDKKEVGKIKKQSFFLLPREQSIL